MKKAILLAVLWSTISLCGAFAQQSGANFTTEVKRSATYVGIFENDQWPWTRWDHNHLLTWQFEASPSRPAVLVLDNEGHIVREAVVWVPGSFRVFVRDAAMTSTGELLVSGSAGNDKGSFADFIAVIDTSGKISNVIRTSPFVPMRICSAGQTFWAYGWQRGNEDRHPRQNYSMLREYSFKDGETNALLDRTSFPESFLITGQQTDVRLVCNASSVALYIGEQENLPVGQFIKHDLGERDSLARWKVPASSDAVAIRGFALNENGDFFVSMTGKKPGTGNSIGSGIFLLKSSSGQSAQWIPVEDTIRPEASDRIHPRLLGAEGNDLVFLTDRQHGTVNWVRVSKKSAESGAAK